MTTLLIVMHEAENETQDDKIATELHRSPGKKIVRIPPYDFTLNK